MAKSIGDFELTLVHAENYLRANQQALGLTDEQVKDKLLQKKYLEDPKSAEMVAHYLFERLVNDWANIFAATGYRNAPLTLDQLTVLTCSNFRMSNFALEQALLANAVYKAGVREGLLKDSEPITNGRIEELIAQLAQKYNVAGDSGFTTRTRAVLLGKDDYTVTYNGGNIHVKIVKPGHLTLAGALVERAGLGTKGLPKTVYATGPGLRNNERLELLVNGSGKPEYYRRDFVSFFRSPLGREIIHRIGGIQNIVPTSDEVINHDPGILRAFNRGANIENKIAGSSRVSLIQGLNILGSVAPQPASTSVSSIVRQNSVARIDSTVVLPVPVVPTTGTERTISDYETFLATNTRLPAAESSETQVASNAVPVAIGDASTPAVPLADITLGKTNEISRVPVAEVAAERKQDTRKSDEKLQPAAVQGAPEAGNVPVTVAYRNLNALEEERALVSKNMLAAQAVKYQAQEKVADLERQLAAITSSTNATLQDLENRRPALYRNMLAAQAKVY